MKRIDPSRKKRLARLALERFRRSRTNNNTNRRIPSRNNDADLQKARYEGVLSYYVANARLSRRQGRWDRAVFRPPTVFSLIENPDETLDSLNKLAGQCFSRPRHVRIDQSGCTTIDLCAAALLNMLARAGIAHARNPQGKRRKMRSINFSGVYPTSLECAEIVAATGLPSELGVDTSGLNGILSNFKFFRLHQGRFRGGESKRSAAAEVCTTNIVEYFDDCLASYGFRMTDESHALLAEMTGEVINNCEDHSGRSEWWVAAYLRQSKYKQVGDCHLTIFNLGRSMADTLQDVPAQSRVRALVASVIERQRAAGVRADFDEALWTVMALQPKISRKNVDTDSLGDRGQGTVRLMAFFHEIGQTKDGTAEPAMVLISGRTYISFDGYHLKDGPPTGPEGRPSRFVAFNASNSFEKRPDRNAVRMLTNRFPGTILSLRFFLDREHLKGVQRVVPRD